MKLRAPSRATSALVLFVLALLTASTASAASVRLAWDASPDAVAGYTLRVGETPGSYSRAIDAGASTDFAVDQLTQGKTYYFIVTGRSADGEETDPTNEISFTVPTTAIPVFDGAGTVDLILQDSAEGWVGGWTMSGTSLTNGALLNPSRVPDLKWKIVGQADFNGDNQRDLVWQHKGNGGLAVWLMQERDVLEVVWLTPSRVPDPDWHVAAVRDMNGDNKPDLLWHHANGSIAVWTMNGTTRIDVLWVTPSRVPEPKWKIVAAADFDKDGKTDILWQHDGGGVAVWLMDGIVRRDVVWLQPDRVPAGWQIVAVADANADGATDIVLSTATGEIAVWFMDGLQLLDGQLLNPSQLPGTTWKIAGPR